MVLNKDTWGIPLKEMHTNVDGFYSYNWYQDNVSLIQIEVTHNLYITAQFSLLKE